MWQSVHLIVAKNIAAAFSCSSLGYYRIHSHVKNRGLKCGFVGATFVSEAKRNPDFSWQNKNRLSRSRNRSNEGRDGFENFEEDMLSSKNGPLVSPSTSGKYQAAAAPGLREKVIAEHIRRIEAELREREAIKEEKKVEASRGQGKESSTKNEPLECLSTSGKYQATAALGPRVNEFRELLRKVQPWWPERETIKEEKKVEVSQGQVKENSTKNGPLVSPSTSDKYQAAAAPGPRKVIAEHFRKIEAELRKSTDIVEAKKVIDEHFRKIEAELRKRADIIELKKMSDEHDRKIEAEFYGREEKIILASRGQGKENSTKNGPLVSLSTSGKCQATAAPGPRVNENVELLRKVMARWHERAAIKEEKKVEASRRQGKENSAVDSLLKLFKKHSVEQVKRSSGGGRGKDFSLDQLQESNQFNGERSTKFSDLGSAPKDESLEANISSVARPRSNFQRWSPVPRAKYQPVFNNEDDSEPDLDELLFPEIAESRTDTWIAKLSEDDSHDSELTYNDESVEEQLVVQHEDLSALKLPELRALAKSRGIKGLSKMRKGELREFLSELNLIE